MGLRSYWPGLGEGCDQDLNLDVGLLRRDGLKPQQYQLSHHSKKRRLIISLRHRGGRLLCSYSALMNPYREDDFRRFIGLITQLPAIMKAIIVSPRFSFRVVPHTLCHTAVVSVLDSVQVATPYTSSPHIAHLHAVVVTSSADASTTDYPNTPERE